jgi:hypothetical protein
MKNPQEYIIIINLLLKKRSEVDGFDSDITFNINELGPELIEDKKRLEEMLSHFKKDKVNAQFGRETVIENFNINENVVTITGSSTKKLEQYREAIINNKVDLSIKPISSLRLPLDTKWEDIIIKFIDGHAVDIYINNRENPIKTSCPEMGFEDKRKRRPNEQWELLKALAQSDGKISWQNQNANLKIKKRKQLLSLQLKNYFGLNEDPFYPYKAVREDSCYQIKFELIPEAGSSSANMVIPKLQNGNNYNKAKIKGYKNNEEEEDKFGIKEYYNEETKKDKINLCE